ncbi:hypothetical protein AXF42_Ash018651 [Apostasia shenzhenica]|uniref:Uncharacterized protein n=1 Tax=Apostasia shenzhenica TaxID=1088818 RepID=A0A2I0B1K0_9ASPA|nr:hypothetical protein AXF42_Ash018651 [Apostasia shenzhenica]
MLTTYCRKNKSIHFLLFLKLLPARKSSKLSFKLLLANKLPQGESKGRKSAAFFTVLKPRPAILIVHIPSWLFRFARLWYLQKAVVCGFSWLPVKSHRIVTGLFVFGSRKKPGRFSENSHLKRALFAGLTSVDQGRELGNKRSGGGGRRPASPPENHERRSMEEEGGLVAAAVAKMESCGIPKQVRSLVQRSSSPSAAAKPLSTAVDGRFGRSQVQDSQNQQHMASSHGIPEQGVLFAEAIIEKITASSRSTETGEVLAAERAGIAVASGSFVSSVLNACRSEPTRPEGAAKTSNATGCTRSSRTEHIVPAVAAVDQNLQWESRAVCSSKLLCAEAAGLAGTNSSNFKPDAGLLGPSDNTKMAAGPAVIAGIFAQNRAECAGSVRNSSTNEIKGLISSHCKEEVGQLLASFSSQQAPLPAHSRGMNLSHPAARGVATHSTACDDVNFIPGEDARGPLGQSGMQVDHTQLAFSFPALSDHSAAANSLNSETCTPTVRQNASTRFLQHSAAVNSTDFALTAASTSPMSRICPQAVRQNTAASFPRHSAAYSNHHSSLQLQSNENQQAPKLALHEQQQQQQTITHQQQKSSAQQYRVVGQQGTGAKTPQNSHLNISTRLNKQKGIVNLLDSAVTIPGLLQKHQKDSVEMVKSTVKIQDNTVKLQDHTIEMRDNTVEVRDSSVEMQEMVQTKQTGTVEMRGSAVAMQGLLQNDNKEVKKAVDFQDSHVQNVVLNAAIENPFVVLDLCMEESDVKPVTNPLILTSSANKKKLKFPLQKFLSPKANTQKGRERISKKHWERELANLRECVTPASDDKMIKRKWENRGDTRQRTETTTGVDVVLPEETNCELQAGPLPPPQHCPISRKYKKRKASTTVLPNAKAPKVQVALPIPTVDFCPASTTTLSTLQDSGQNKSKRKCNAVPTTPSPLSWHDEGEKFQRKTPRLAGNDRDSFYANIFSAGCCKDGESSTRPGKRKAPPPSSSSSATEDDQSHEEMSSTEVEAPPGEEQISGESETSENEAMSVDYSSPSSKSSKEDRLRTLATIAIDSTPPRPGFKKKALVVRTYLPSAILSSSVGPFSFAQSLPAVKNEAAKLKKPSIAKSEKAAAKPKKPAAELKRSTSKPKIATLEAKKSTTKMEKPTAEIKGTSAHLKKKKTGPEPHPVFHSNCRD